jgi:hypothetical protein
VQLAADFLTEEMMPVHTLTHTESAPTPLQTGEPFHCWECGALDQGGRYLIIDHSPLERYIDHIYYMQLDCGHNPRCVRLGDTVAPLPPLDRSIPENLAIVQDGLARLARAVPPDQRHQDPLARVVYLLVARRIAPQTAINQLRTLIDQPALTIPLQLNERSLHG